LKPIVTVQSPLAQTTTAESVISIPFIKIEQIAVDQQIEPVFVSSEAPAIVQKKVKRISVEQYLKTKLVATTKLTTDDKMKAENGLPSEITVENPPIKPVSKVMKWGLVRLSLPEKNNQLATVVEQQDVGFLRVVDPRRNGAVHICRDEKSLNMRCIYIPFNSRGNGVPTVSVPTLTLEQKAECLTPVTIGQKVQCVTPVTDGQKAHCLTTITGDQNAQCLTPVVVGQNVQCVTPVTVEQKAQCVTPLTNGHKAQCLTPVMLGLEAPCLAPSQTSTWYESNNINYLYYSSNSGHQHGILRKKLTYTTPLASLVAPGGIRKLFIHYLRTLG